MIFPIATSRYPTAANPAIAVAVRNVAEASQNTYLVSTFHHCLSLKRSDQHYQWALMQSAIAFSDHVLVRKGDHPISSKFDS